MPPAPEAEGGSVNRLEHLRRSHMDEGDVRLDGEECTSRVHAATPCPFNDPDLERRRNVAAVAKTTGVRSRTVASRLRTAVAAEPTTNTQASNLLGLPWDAAAITRPAA